MLKRLFKPRPARIAGQSLYARTVVQARSTTLYTELGVPDTAEGRFELYSLHVWLLLDRLAGQGAQAAETSQALFDTYVSALDNALREMGVGDLSVGKRMRKLGEAFFGRIRAYQAAMAGLPDTAPLQALLIRTAYAGIVSPKAGELAAYIVAQRHALSELPLERLYAGDVNWAVT